MFRGPKRERNSKLAWWEGGKGGMNALKKSGPCMKREGCKDLAYLVDSLQEVVGAPSLVVGPKFIPSVWWGKFAQKINIETCLKQENNRVPLEAKVKQCHR